MDDTLVRLLSDAPTEIFCHIWAASKIYNYDQIRDLILAYPELRLQIEACLYRVDIDAEVTKFALLSRLKILIRDSPVLREINLSNWTLRQQDLAQIGKTRLHNLKNIQLIDVQLTTVSTLLLDILSKLANRWCNDLIFDVRCLSEPDEGQYYLQYKDDTFTFCPYGLDYADDKIVKMLYDCFTYLKPTTYVVTEGSMIYTVSESITELRVQLEPDVGYVFSDCDILAALIYNQEHIRHLHNNKYKEDENLNFFEHAEDTDRIFRNPDDLYDRFLYINQCSITRITYVQTFSIKHLNDPFGLFIDSRSAFYVFPTIRVMEIPCRPSVLRYVIWRFPSVCEFYYFVMEYEEDIIQELQTMYPEKIFVPYY